MSTTMTTTEEPSETHSSASEETEARPSPNVVIFRHPLDETPRILLLLLFYAAAIYISIAFPVTVQRIPLGVIFGKELSIGLPLAAIVPIVMMGSIVHSLYDVRYVLTPDYVMEIEGLLSFNERSVRLHYIHIRGMEIERNIFQKMFNIGNLKLGSAIAQGDSDVVLRGVFDPRRYKDIINERIMERMSAEGGHENNSIFEPGGE